MKTIIIAFLMLIVCARAAQADCWSTRLCTSANYCNGLVVTSADPQCVNATPVGWEADGVRHGRICTSISGPGASGCVQALRGVYVPSSQSCVLTASASLLGVGCCGQPCPPPGTNCQPD